MDTTADAPNRRRWLAHAGGLCLALARPAAAVTTAGADPAFAGHQDGEWPDAARGRGLPWRLRLPGTAGPWPLALFSHGLGGSRSGGMAWGEAWRAAGIAALHLQHPGSDTPALRGGVGGLRAAASPQQLVERAADVRFVLDELERRARAGEAPWRNIRLDAIGMSGHSFGAHTTQAVAGQRYPSGGSLADPRPRAFIAFSPSQPARGRMSAAEAFGAITRPFLAITGSLDGDPFGSYDSGEPRAGVYDGLPPGQRALLWLDGADHMTFGGGGARVPDRGPFKRRGPAAERQGRHEALVARITTLWWRAHLLGDAAARQALALPQDLSPGDRFTVG